MKVDEAKWGGGGIGASGKLDESIGASYEAASIDCSLSVRNVVPSEKVLRRPFPLRARRVACRSRPSLRDRW